MKYFIKIVIIGLVFFMSKVLTLSAETKPLMIEITQGIIKPMPIITIFIKYFINVPYFLD